MNIMKSEQSGCFYTVRNKVLFYSPMLADGSCDQDWVPVEEISSPDELTKINDYFGTDFKAEFFQ